MKIETTFVYPPIPDRNFDWCAIDGDTFCCAECHSPVGYGATEQAAIADLLEKIAEKNPPEHKQTLEQLEAMHVRNKSAREEVPLLAQYVCSDRAGASWALKDEIYRQLKATLPQPVDPEE